MPPTPTQISTSHEKKSDLILVYIGSEVAIDALVPVTIKIFSKHQNVKIVLYGQERLNLKAKIPFYLQAITTFHETLPQNDLLICCAVLITDVPKPPTPNAKVFVISHGSIPSKYNDFLWKVADVYFGQFDDEFKQFQQSHQDESKEFIVAGTPKQDPIKWTRDARKEQRIRKKYGIEENKKVITIISHWSQYGILRTFNSSFYQAAQQFALKNELEMIAHCHPKLVDATLKDEGYDRTSVHRTLEEIKEIGIQVSVGGGMEFLSITDILVGDCTSTMAQASISCADIICFRPNKIPVPAFDRDFRAMLHEFLSPSEFLDAASRCLEFPNSKHLEKQNFANKYILNTSRPEDVISLKVLSDISSCS